MAEFVKTYSDAYIYRMYPRYDEDIFKYLVNAEIISKNTPNFEDAKYQIKRRAVSSAFVNCMESDNVVFLRGEILKPFRVVTAKDIRKRVTNEMALDNYLESVAKGKAEEVPVKPKKKSNGEEADKVIREDFTPYSVNPFTEEVAVGAPLKVFVNIDTVFDKDNNLKDPETFICYLTSALTNLIYYKMPSRLFNSNAGGSFGADCFCKLFTHIVDYMAKISVVGNNKQKCEYAAYKYYYTNIACTFEGGKANSRFSSSVRQKCLNAVEISDREAGVIDTAIDEDDYKNINTFVTSLADYLKIPGLSLDNFVEKWMYIYGGPVTVFALEYFPSFATMITDAYHGCYLNNQKTIEKICGNSMVGFTKDLIQIAG